MSTQLQRHSVVIKYFFILIITAIPSITSAEMVSPIEKSSLSEQKNIAALRGLQWLSTRKDGAHESFHFLRL